MELGSITARLAAYEGSFAFARSITPAEEDRAAFIATPWVGGYRWWRASNVIGIEKLRALRQLEHDAHPQNAGKTA